MLHLRRHILVDRSFPLSCHDGETVSIRRQGASSIDFAVDDPKASCIVRGRGSQNGPAGRQGALTSKGDAKAATMRDVADFAGVALTTVSRAFSEPDKLSPATLRRIQSASRELGYTVNFNARSLRRKSSGLLLVLLPDIGNPFFSLVLKGIESAAREGGRVLLIGDTGSDASLADNCAGQLDAGAVDGLILIDGRLPFAPESRGRSRLMLSPWWR